MPAAAGSATTGDSEPKPRRKRRWLRAALLLVAAVVLLVALAPTLLSTGPVREPLLVYAGGRLGCEVRADGLTLSWFGNQSVSGLTVAGPDGQPALKVGSLTLSQGLAALAWDPDRIGAVALDGAEVWPKELLRVKDAVAERFPSPPEVEGEPPAPPRPMRLPESVTVKDLVLRGPTGAVRVTQASFRTAAGQATGHADLEIEQAAARGTAAVDVEITGLQSGGAGAAPLGIVAKGQYADLAVGPILEVLPVEPARITGGGTVTGAFDVSRSADGRLGARFTCDGKDLWATGEVLQGDRPALGALHLEVDGTYAGGVLEVRRLALASAVAEAQATGTFAMHTEATQPPTGEGTGRLQVSLAPLARMLPHTLRLHEDMSLESGMLTASLGMTSDGETVHAEATADLKDLRGRRGDRAVALAPVHLEAEVEQAKGEFAARNISLTGPFGSLSARGRLEAFTLDADLKLKEATDQAGQFIDLGPYAAAGAAQIHAETSGTVAEGVRVAAKASLADFRIRLDKDREWEEPQATLAADGRLRFDDQRRLAGVSVEALALASAAGKVEASGTAERQAEQWSFKGDAKGGGDLGQLARLIRVLLGRPGEAISGGWDLDAHAAGVTRDAVAATFSAHASNVKLPRGAAAGESAAAEPIEQADVRADVRYAFGSPDLLTVNELRVQGPGVSASAAGSFAMPTAPTRRPGAEAAAAPPARTAAPAAKGEAKVSADLATVARLVGPFGLLPEGFRMAGSANLTLKMSDAKGDRVPADLTAWASDLDLAWKDGRRLREAKVSTSVEGAVLLGEGGGPAGALLTSWFVEGSPGRMSGTAEVHHQGDAWTYAATYTGGGRIAPLAETVAGLLSAGTSPITGTWKADGQVASPEGKDIQVEASAQATDLVIPRSQPDGASADRPPDVRLSDVRLDASATLAANDTVAIRRLDLSGPGVTLKAAGSVRTASEDSGRRTTADGSVSLQADLAQVTEVLRPFGVLAPGSRLAGKAVFDGKVASDPAGLAGTGTLDVTGLAVHLAGPQITLQEPTAHVPLTFAQVAKEHRWQVGLKGIRSALASGDASGSLVLADDTSTLDARCDLQCDGERMRAALGARIPAQLRMAKTWGITANVRGPWPRQGAWNEKAANLTGDGIVETGSFAYRGLAGDQGKIRLRLADGQLVLAPDAKQPSRMSVNEGTVTLGGRADLRATPASYDLSEHLLAADRIRLNEEVTREFLKFTSPILAVSVKPGGLLSTSIEEAHVPLAEGQAAKARVRGQVWIDGFQAELSGPLGQLVQWAGAPTQMPVQKLGPFDLDLKDGTFRISNQQLKIREGLALRLNGTVGVDGKIQVTVGMPLTAALLKRFGVSEKVLPMLADQEVRVPLKGTVDRPELDEKALGAEVVRMGLEALRRKAIQDIGSWIDGAIRKREEKP